ncbi:MAG: FAD-binding protein [SAR324 cluster bacterium]|nr:FAD-binding protein [SAR324 cluster bacterium]
MTSQIKAPISCDVLIIGGGGAGLRAAIEAKELGADVAVVSKSRIGYGNNTIISAGIMAATGWGEAEDGHDVHVKDTVLGGRYLNDQKLVAVTAAEATAQATFLEKCGVAFAQKDGMLQVEHIPGHSYPRHLSTAQKGGRGLILPLIASAEKIGVRCYDQVFISKLFADNNQIKGAGGFSKDGQFLSFAAKSVILATGGFAQLYQKTDNAQGITGTGHILAHDLGITLKDMEFVQFYPTSLGRSGSRILLYEIIVTRFGGKIRNSEGADILEKHGMKERIQKTRDRVTRAIITEMRDGFGVDGGVILDLSPVTPLSKLKPFLPESWTEDQTKLIVSPTTHFCMGGIQVDPRLETAITGLYGAGEICGGVHGANRLGGNALAEVFALGGVAGRNAAGWAGKTEPAHISAAVLQTECDRLASFYQNGQFDAPEIRNKLKETMWRQVGIIRRGKELTEALHTIEELKQMAMDITVQSPQELMQFLELQNMLVLSQMVCQAALQRTESRGAHYRSDFPAEDNRNWLCNIVIKKKETSMELACVPVSMDYVSVENPD